MARCPLSEVIREEKQLGSYPPRCREQCQNLIEASISEGDYDIEDHTEFIENDKCSHLRVEPYEQSIVRIGESAVRDFVLHEFCPDCDEEVQATIYRFECPHEVN